MADKRVQIGVGDLTLNFARVTKVDAEESIDSDVTPCFDENVTSATESGYKIDVSALEARNLDEFITLKKILKRMKSESGFLSVFETVKHKTGDFESENYYTGVMLSSNKVSYDAKSLTARDVSFNAESYVEKVNGEEIK